MSRHEVREIAFQLLFQLGVRENEGTDEEQIQDFLRHIADCREEAAAAEEGGEARHLDADEKRYEKLCCASRSEADLAFLGVLVHGVLKERRNLDKRLQSYLKDWRFQRLPQVDRALLRLGAYEILHVPDVPKNVSISEIVLLANRYADEISKRYINGVLANLEKPEAS